MGISTRRSFGQPMLSQCLDLMCPSTQAILTLFANMYRLLKEVGIAVIPSFLHEIAVFKSKLAGMVSQVSWCNATAITCVAAAFNAFLVGVFRSDTFDEGVLRTLASRHNLTI